MASPFIVEWYQLNASPDTMGESAIAILVKQDGGKGSIQSVVLVDGGMSKTAKLIVQVLDEIGAAYAKTPLKIDTIVLTHWDQVSNLSYLNSYASTWNTAQVHLHRITASTFWLQLKLEDLN